METVWVLIAAVILIGFFYVLVPLVINTFQWYRRKRVLRCPETGMLAEVDIDAKQAAFSSPFGKPLLRVKNCTLWPEKENCHMECLEKVK
jgi:hypothetical protein